MSVRRLPLRLDKKPSTISNISEQIRQQALAEYEKKEAIKAVAKQTEDELNEINNESESDSDASEDVYEDSNTSHRRRVTRIEITFPQRKTRALNHIYKFLNEQQQKNPAIYKYFDTIGLWGKKGIQELVPKMYCNIYNILAESSPEQAIIMTRLRNYISILLTNPLKYKITRKKFRFKFTKCKHTFGGTKKSKKGRKTRIRTRRNNKN